MERPIVAVVLVGQPEIRDVDCLVGAAAGVSFAVRVKRALTAISAATRGVRLC